MIGTIASGLLLFVLPGALLTRASGARPQRGELLAWAFAGSLAALFVSFAITVALALPLQAALWPLGGLVTLAALAVLAGHRAAPAEAAGDVAVRAARGQQEEEAQEKNPRWWLLLLVALTAAAAVAASHFASVGSIDRWWYLAYVRGYLGSDALRLSEPFLGTERVFARFGVHPWLMGLALWSKLSGADPVWLYERAAPVLAIGAAVSATVALSRALFGSGAVARAAVFATLLSWSGALLPVLARAGEDKVLAQAALATLCLAGCLSAVRGKRGALALAALAAIATATVHGLVFAFVLAAWLPLAALRAVRAAGERRALVATSALLLVVAIQPALIGLRVERGLVEAGALSGVADHPVLRVHESRDRTIDVGSLGFLVHPRLLAHPLSLLALAALASLLLRRRRDLTGDFLLVSSAAALLIAFVPPLPALAARVLPGWMVYRVLWIVPVGPLAALSADRVRRHLRVGESLTFALLLALSAFALAGSIQQRQGEARARRAVPSTSDFAAAMQAVAALPPDALVAAAPLLAERLPALTGRHVVAALDRSTVVMSGSRKIGEARLRLRAATLSGDERSAAFAADAVVKPTHALFDPRAAARPACAQVLLRTTSYALCSLAELPAAAAASASLQRLDGAAVNRQRDGAPPLERISTHGNAGNRCSASCTPRPRGELVAVSQPGDWEAVPPLVDCRIQCGTDANATIDSVEFVPIVGRAVDEFLVRVRGSSRGREVYTATAGARSSGAAAIRFALPQVSGTEIDGVELRVASGLLPFVKLRDVAWNVSASADSD